MEKKGLLHTHLLTWLSHHTKGWCATSQSPSDSTFHVLVQIRTDLKMLNAGFTKHIHWNIARCFVLSNTCPSEEQPAYPTGNFCAWNGSNSLCLNTPALLQQTKTGKLFSVHLQKFDWSCLPKVYSVYYWAGFSSGLLTIHIAVRKSERMSTHRQHTHLQRDFKSPKRF